jgi:hypothetical protein
MWPRAAVWAAAEEVHKEKYGDGDGWEQRDDGRQRYPRRRTTISLAYVRLRCVRGSSVQAPLPAENIDARFHKLRNKPSSIATSGKTTSGCKCKDGGGGGQDEGDAGGQDEAGGGRAPIVEMRKEVKSR